MLDQRPPLLRRRALPTAVIISAELKKAATSRERCRLYVDKLNELGRERSRLDEWILATKGDHWSAYTPFLKNRHCDFLADDLSARSSRHVGGEFSETESPGASRRFGRYVRAAR